MSEASQAPNTLPVSANYKSFVIFHHATIYLERFTTIIPVILIQISVFALVAYFMVESTMPAANSFTEWIMTLAISTCMTALPQVFFAFPTMPSVLENEDPTMPSVLENEDPTMPSVPENEDPTTSSVLENENRRLREMLDKANERHQTAVNEATGNFKRQHANETTRLRERALRYDADLASLKDKISNCASQIDALKARLRKKDETILAIENDLNERNHRVQALETENANKDIRIEKLQIKNNDKEICKQGLWDTIQRLKIEDVDKDKLIKGLETQRAANDALIEELRTEVQGLQTQVRGLDTQNTDKDALIEELRTELQGLDTQNANEGRRIEELQTQVRGLKTKVDTQNANEGRRIKELSTQHQRELQESEKNLAAALKENTFLLEVLEREGIPPAGLDKMRKKSGKRARLVSEGSSSGRSRRR